MRLRFPNGFPCQAALGILFGSGLCIALPDAAAARALDRPSLVAFGDSITSGEGFDDPTREEFGYPPRLEQLLADDDLDFEVENFGKGGEDTIQGLTRIDSVLAGVVNGELLLLMEGTNDIAREISFETTLFNLDEMARKAIDRGLVTVHATVIPRSPTARKDPNNVRTREMNDLIRDLAFETGRVLSDQWNVFTAQPNYYQNLYYQDPLDPVGHPNAAGYDVMADGWLPKVAQALQRAEVSIAGPDTAETGVPLRLSAVVDGVIERAEWRFGDGGLAWSSHGPGFAVDYFYLTAGEYEVTVTGFDQAGRRSENRHTVVVEGDEVAATNTSESYLQSLIFGPRGNTGTYRSTLSLHNSGPDLALSELFYYPRGGTDAPPRRVIPIRPGETVRVDNLLGDAFDLTSGSGSLGLRSHVLQFTGNTPEVQAYSNSVLDIGEPEEGSFGQLVPEEPGATWSQTKKVVGGIQHGNGVIATLLAANLDGNNGKVDITLVDSTGLAVDGQAALTLASNTMRFRNLNDLFPSVGGRLGPFTATFSSTNIRFAASTTLLELASEDQIFVPARTQPTAGTIYVPRVVSGIGQFDTRLSSQLVLVNAAAVPTELEIALWLRGQENLTPQVTTLTLAGGESRVIPNVIPDLFGLPEATGALAINWSNDEAKAPFVHSYGYATASTGTSARFGMLVSALDGRVATGSDAITTAAEVFGAEQTTLDRTSYGVMNLSPFTSRVRVLLLDSLGVEINATELSLRGQQHLERNLLGVFSGLVDGRDWTLRTEVISGGPVLSYMARINVSGDVFFVPAKPLP